MAASECPIIESTLPLTPDIAGGVAGLGPGACLGALVIDNEIIDSALRYLRGIEVNGDTLAVDAINKVGHGGSVLQCENTVKIMH